MGGVKRMPINHMDKEVYLDYLAQIKDSYIEPEHVGDYFKYVISAYPYFKSRLLIPGRCYEDDNHGSMAIGGSAHADLMDLEQWLKGKDGNMREEILDWMRGSSLEQVAYWRGLGKNNKGTISRRRSKIAQKATKDINKQQLSSA